jgi:carboxypeptidase D
MPSLALVFFLLPAVALPGQLVRPDALVRVEARALTPTLLHGLGATVEERWPDNTLLVRVPAGAATLPRAVPVSADADRWFHARAVERAARLSLPSIHDVRARLERLAADHPDLVSLEVLAHTEGGHDVVAVKVGDNPAQDADVAEPEPSVLVSAVHHGDEGMGALVVLELLDFLVENHGHDQRVTSLVDGIRLFAVPVINPDGWEDRTRGNGQGVDLNRNYGFMWAGGGTPYSEPEAAGMHALIRRESFSLGLSFHTEETLVNGVWNHRARPAPDDRLVMDMASGYAALAGYRATRGYAWYQVNGDADDHMYGVTGAPHFTVETAADDLPAVWEANREALLYVMDRVRTGIHLRLTDRDGAPVEGWARVGRSWRSLTRPGHGDLHRAVLPGLYTVVTGAPGFQDAVLHVNVTEGALTQATATLQPGGPSYALALSSVKFRPVHDTAPEDAERRCGAFASLCLAAEATWVLGPANGAGFPLGGGGAIVLDLGPRVPPGFVDQPVISVVEAPGHQHPWELSASRDEHGPFTLVASGRGSRQVPVSSFPRYVKLRDTSPVSDFLGLVLDAVELRTSLPLDAGTPHDAATLPDAGNSLDGPGLFPAPDGGDAGQAGAAGDAPTKPGCPTGPGGWSAVVLLAPVALRRTRERPPPGGPGPGERS